MLKEIGIKNIITAIFVFAAIFAFLVFANVIKVPGAKQEASGKITVWGTIPFPVMQPYINQVKSKNIEVNYTFQDPVRFEEDLVNAFASGTGPDLFITGHEQILRNADKIFEIPFTSFPQNEYEATYINESKLFFTDTGALAIPMAVDPLIMYYNKSLIASAFLVGTPEYWEDLLAFAADITLANANGAISNAGVSLGTFENILNAKGILSTMLLQNGNAIVGVDPMSTQMQGILTNSDDRFAAAEQALKFYTSFSRLGNQNYSWNEALPLSREKFIAGELALYFGKGSELERIRKKNPNLDFDVALMPQISKTSLKTTFGSMTGVAIAKQTKNPAAAIQIASRLTGSDVVKAFTKEMGVAPARKDLLKNKPDDARATLLYNSAIISGGWVDPDPKATDLLFKNLIRAVNTGSLSISEALRKADADLQIILNRTINTTITDKTTESIS